MNCNRCGKHIEKGEGLFVKYAERSETLCTSCYETAMHDEPHEALKRQTLFDHLMQKCQRGHGDLETREECAIFDALDLGYRVLIPNQFRPRAEWKEVTAARGHFVRGYQGDGVSSPSWYRSNDQRWSTFTIHDVRTGKTYQDGTPLLVVIVEQAPNAETGKEENEN